MRRRIPASGTQFAASPGMKTTLLTFAIGLALATLAGCDRNPDQRANQSTSTPPASSAATGGTATATTPSTPANVGQPQSQGEKREGANPVQQQVDPKQPEQHRDFRTQGDGAGPRSPDTQPKPGG